MDDPVTRREDDRPVAGSSATLSNVGPARSGRIDEDDSDVLAGTSSGHGVRGKPTRGSLGARDW